MALTLTRDAATLMAARAPFKIGGLSAVTEGHGSVGDMPDNSRMLFEAHSLAGGISYVVRSYDIPILWIIDGQPFMPLVRYSPTTSRHQDRVALAFGINFVPVTRAVPIGTYGGGWAARYYGTGDA